VSIGEDLAQARHRAGLTVREVSQRTCIRETLIRAIEHDDYGGCGGDFYARGHIRAIARAVGADPVPLIAAYDAAHHRPQPATAADLAQPVRPVRIREPHRPHWAAVLGLALLAVTGVTAYHLLARQPTYQELGADYFDPRHAERLTRRAVQALERQGYRVTLARADMNARPPGIF